MLLLVSGGDDAEVEGSATGPRGDKPVLFINARRRARARAGVGYRASCRLLHFDTLM
jgi:hypothetical protein